MGSEAIFSITGFISLLVYFLFHISRNSLISLIAFKSIIIRNYLIELKENSSKSNFFYIYKTIMKIKTSVQIFDNQISFAIFLALLMTTFTSLSGLCLIALNFKDCAFYVLISIFDSMVYLFVLCFVTEILPKNVEKFFDEMEVMLTETQIADPIAIQYLQGRI